MILDYKELLKCMKEQSVPENINIDEIFKNPDDILLFLKELLSENDDNTSLIKENWDLLCEFISPLKCLENIPQNSPYHYADVFNHTMDAVSKYDENNWIVRLALLFHDTGKKYVRTTTDGVDHFYGHADVSRSIVGQWGSQFSDSRTLASILFLVGTHNNSIPISKTSVKRFMTMFNELDITVYDWIAMKRADILAHKITSNLLQKLDTMESLVKVINQYNIYEEIKKSLPINGLDIKSLGFNGKDIGIIKRDCLQYFISSNFLLSKNDLVEYIKSKYFDKL